MCSSLEKLDIKEFTIIIINAEGSPHLTMQPITAFLM